MSTPTNPNEVIWSLILTKELVDGWTDAEIEALCSDLDNVVMHVIQDYQQRRDQ